MSRFLAELRRRELVEPWGEGFTEPAPDAVNRLADRSMTAQWPEPAADDDVALARRRAADAVTAFLAPSATVPVTPLDVSSAEGGDAASEPRGDSVVRRWREEAALLLAERIRSRGESPAVRMPPHLPATRLDDLRADGDRFALDLRRPLPPEPRPAGRLGTVFHEAVALRLSGRGQLLTLEQAGVPTSLTPGDREQLDRWLQVAENLPLLDGYALDGTEVELELALEPVALRCRLDAVFRGRDGTWLIIDWKTGGRRVPVDQLSTYVHALAASRGVATGAVRAAYVYVNSPGGRVDELTAEDLLPLTEIEAALRTET